MIVAAVGLLALVACGKSRNDSAVETSSAAGRTAAPSGPEAANRGVTMVRFVNVVPGAASAALVSNDRALFQNVAYRNVTPYAEMDPNITRLSLRLAGRDSSVAENREIVGDGAHYTVVAYADNDGSPRLRVLRDELQPEPGKAKLRVIQAAPDLEKVQVVVQGATEPIFNDIELGNEAGFTNVTPTRQPLVIRRDARSGPLLTITRLPLDSGHAYTVVLTRSPQNRLEAVTFEDTLAGHHRPQ